MQTHVAAGRPRPGRDLETAGRAGRPGDGGQGSFEPAGSQQTHTPASQFCPPEGRVVTARTGPWCRKGTSRRPPPRPSSHPGPRTGAGETPARLLTCSASAVLLPVKRGPGVCGVFLVARQDSDATRVVALRAERATPGSRRPTAGEGLCFGFCAAPSRLPSYPLIRRGCFPTGYCLFSGEFSIKRLNPDVSAL